jgi:hypothetical protein
MRVASVQQPGSIRVQEVEVPRPVNPDDVVVKVMASGICGTDVHIFRGEYLGSYPIVPGHEFSGVVEAVGEKVRALRAGGPCRRRAEHLLRQLPRVPFQSAELLRELAGSRRHPPGRNGAVRALS